MGKINFLGDNNNSGGAGDLADRNEGMGEQNIEWTSPEKIIAADKGNNNSGGGAFDTIEKIKNRLRFVDERQTGAGQPLAGDDDIAVKKNEPEISAKQSGEKVKSAGFFGKIFNFKKSRNHDTAGHEIKNRKEIIAGYGDAISDEKKIRKNYNGLAGQNDYLSRDIINNGQDRPEIAKDAVPAGRDKWKAPKILKTDLIKDEVTVFIDWKKNIINLSANLAMTAIIIAMAYFGLEYWGQSSAQQVKSLDNEIQDLARKINQSKDAIKAVDIFQKKLSLAGKIIDQHIYWTNFFNFLEKDTLPNIKFNGGFRGDISGNYTFSAIAPSFNDLADQVRVFRADTANVVTVGASKGVLSSENTKNSSGKSISGAANVEFSMSLAVNPKIFSK